jgi:uncharacterized membrane protein YfcA
VSLPEFSLFSVALADHRFWIALGIAVLAGIVRGFSGFGSAQIYVPLIASIYSPRSAAVTLLLIDTFGTAPFAVRAFTRCTWREVIPMSIAAAISVPLGALALRLIDPVVLRWFIAILVLTLVCVLMSGWRYHGRPRLPITVGVGLFSGFSAGAVQIAGPPVLIYWLGTTTSAQIVRANFLVFFIFLNAFAIAVYFWQGLFTPELLAISLMLAIPFFLATTAGAKVFHGSSETIYRRVAYVIITCAAIVSLPVFDHWLR